MRNIKYSFVFCLLSIGLHAQNRDMLDVKIGQMLLIGFSKAEVDPDVLQAVREGKVGTILIFEKNVPKGNSSFAALKKIIWTYQKAASIPLLISIDQEGGKVNRLKDKYGFTRSITAHDMGKAKTLDSVQFYSEATAATLAGLGINVNFAPVVDLEINKENMLAKAGRSFSANADSAAMYAEIFVKAHRRFGVMTALKHFPGHGSSTGDTHFGLVDITKTWTESELIPYKRLLATNSVDAIMSAHVVNKQLDPRGYPGTLSSRMIDSLLRKQMGYDGLVFSDDMQMQAITKQYPLEESIKLAINAGIDILCFSNNIQGSEERTVDKVHGIIRSLVERGQIKQERIDEAFNRIMKVKSKIGTPPEEYLKRELEVVRQELFDLKKANGTIPEIKTEKPVVTEPVVVPVEEETPKKKKKKS